MKNVSSLINQIKQQQLLPLFYHDDPLICIEVTKALYAAGIRCIEFTNRGASALNNFTSIVAERDKNMQDLLLAVGTIRNPAQVHQFIDAGADFLISPFFEKNIYETVTSKKIFWIPGCMTPTEINIAVNAGCTTVKLFPGNVLGPTFVAGVKELFPSVDFIVTGGVEGNKENMEAWFTSGVCAVGMGSKLISKKLMEQQDYAAITATTFEVLDIIKALKKQK